MIKRIFGINERLSLIFLFTRITWPRFKSRRVQMLKSEFLIYTLFILFLGLGLGMAWRASQVEPNLKAQIEILSNARSELVMSQYGIAKNQNE